MATRRKILILTGSLLAAFVVGGLLVLYLLTIPAPLESWLQDRIVLALREHYQSNVQLQNLHATLIPEFEASGDALIIPGKNAAGLPPLIMVKHFEVRAGVMELLRKPVHLSHLRLEGLQINVGPKGTPASQPTKTTRHTRLANFVIDKVDADGTVLYVHRKDPSKEPMEWDLRKLALRSAGIGQPMKFTAELTNPTPPGLIETRGKFGPWNMEEPSATAVSGSYDFQHADLSVFNGVSGILSSKGDYTGMLQNIVVDGTTDVPDFKLDRGGHQVHLTTEFHAVVDGTNGDTYLQPVTAHFLHSEVVTNGDVSGKPGQHGKTITLNVDMQQAYVQDVLNLASKSDPPILSGRMKLKANLVIPPGKEPVLRKLVLGGKFNVTEARFSNQKIENAIAELSRRGQGLKNDGDAPNVPAQFAGNFLLKNRNLAFSSLQFVVPGVAAQMKGSYGLASEQLKFDGDVRLHATVSQMIGGSKGWILTPFDPIFSRHGAGTFLPVQVAGTRQQPQIKLNWKKLF